MSDQSKKQVSIHLFNALSKSNVGTIAAQRAICQLLIEKNFDLSVSASDKEIFKSYHPECKTVNVYEPMHPNLGGKITRNHLQWVCFTVWNLLILTFTCMLITIKISVPNRRKLIRRLKSCDVFLDQNLELFKGIPISLSEQLGKQKSRTIVFHKIFWSFRMFYTVWSIFCLKGTFKKKVVIGPASFGPFAGLPVVTKWMVKHVLNRYVNVILVREPCSAIFLKNLGVRNQVTVADAALLVRKDTQRQNRKNVGLTIGFAPALLTQTLTAMQINDYAEAHAKVIDELITGNVASSVLLLPSSGPDVDISKKIMTLSNAKTRITLVDTEDLTEYESQIPALDLLITSRMHPSIIASRNFIPFGAVIYDHKQIGVLQQLGLQEFALPIGSVTYDTLRDLTFKTFMKKDFIRQQLISLIPTFQVLNLAEIVCILKN